jgi:TBC1 domain family member 7
MEDARNFRSSYYEKVGCRSVEEKKSLEIMLKEDPVNLIKLKQFLKLFSVPSLQRCIIYNVVLGVYPIYMESKECVMEQKKEIYDDLQRALTCMGYIDEKTPKNRVFYAMWLLETRQLPTGMNIYVSQNFPNH